VGIIMDGNGRWASAKGRPRSDGHRAGSKVVRKVVEAAPDLGISVLSLYAFSSDNWRRPSMEVESLMILIKHYLKSEIHSCIQNGVRINVIGKRDRLAPHLVKAIEKAESLTEHLDNLNLRIAVDYSARDAIVRATERFSTQQYSREAFERVLGEVIHAKGESPDVDLLIRTGGEKRLSDFLLWESAYAELYFCDDFWPDFKPDHLTTAVNDFRKRERRFGRIQMALPGSAVLQ
jgi:undecaprenyl diphosphate synthase